MTTKVAQRGFTEQEVREELKEIKAWKSKAPKEGRLTEIARFFAAQKQWDQAVEAFELISNEKERNLLIADLIEKHLLPLHDISQAKRIAKYLTPVLEIEALVWIRIALADNDTEEALRIAQRLPSPIARNFAYQHIMESYFASRERAKATALRDLILDNVRTIYDNKTRSFILRELALNLYLANSDREEAKKIAALIPDEVIRTQVINKIS